MSDFCGYIFRFDQVDPNGLMIAKDSIDMSGLERQKEEGRFDDFRVDDIGVFVTGLKIDADFVINSSTDDKALLDSAYRVCKQEYAEYLNDSGVLSKNAIEKKFDVTI